MTHDPGPAFRALHVRGDPFILANAWDLGSARMLAALGAQALATSSAAHAFTLGNPDGLGVTRDQAMTHAAEMVAATSLPVSGDLENGFGPAPEDCAETVRLACEAGLAGLCLEDTDLPGDGAYDRAHAVERMRAAVAACKTLPRDMVLIARADGCLTGTYSLDEAIARVQAFADVGVDGVYIPLPGDLEAVARITAAVDIPVNALAVGPLAGVTRAQFAKAGVARISLGSALARVTHRAIHDTARAMFDQGDFSGLAKGISGGSVDALLKSGAT